MLETVFSEILADSSFAVFAVLASEQFHMVKTVFLKSVKLITSDDHISQRYGRRSCESVTPLAATVASS